MKHPPSHILLIGKCSLNPDVYTYPTSFVRALQDLGHSVNLINTHHAARSRSEQFLSRCGSIGRSLALHLFNKNLITTIKDKSPDVLFIIKGSSVTAQTLRHLKTTYPVMKIVHFYPDNPFCLWNGNSNVHVLESLPYIDHFLIWSKELIPILIAAGAPRVHYFPFAYDGMIYGPQQTTQSLSSKIYDACFVGTWDRERESMLTHLIKKTPNLVLGIWGNRWQESLTPTSPLRKYLHGEAVYKDAMLKIFAASKIVLNFIRPQNLQAHNMRTFECLASGNFMLTQHTQEQTETPFKEGFNIACFYDPEDLVKKIAFYLNNDNLREKVGERGVVVAQEFALRRQLAQVLTILETGTVSEKREETKNSNFIHP